MRIRLNKEKAIVIRIAYCTFFGLYVLAFILKLSELKIFGIIASGVSWGTYITLFLCGIKVFIDNKLLLISNICFLIFSVIAILYALSDSTDIVGLSFALASILLFLIISNKTLGLLEEKYRDK